MMPLTIRIYSHRVIDSSAILDSRLLRYFVVVRPARWNGLRDRMPQLKNPHTWPGRVNSVAAALEPPLPCILWLTSYACQPGPSDIFV